MNFHYDLLANFIIQQYFLGQRCLFVFVDENNTFEYTGLVPIVNIRFDETFNFDRVFHYFGCNGILVKSDTPAVFFESFEKEVRLRMERVHHRKYLIVPGIYMKGDIDAIFETNAINYVTDMIVLQETNSSVLIWTNKYVGIEDNNQKVLLDEWYFENQTFLMNNDLYPDKLLNQMGKVLRLGTIDYAPYIILTDDDIHKNKGSELKPALIYSKRYNLTPIIISPNHDEYWGAIYENWTGYGLLGNLIYDKVDITFAAMYMWDAYHLYIDYSKPMVKSAVTLLVPSPKILTGWLTPIYAYNFTIWIVLLVIFIISIFLLYLLYHNSTRSHRLGTSTFTMFKLFILQNLLGPELPPGVTGKYFMLMMFVFEVFLSSTYGSGLASIMTVPRYEAPIDTIEDLAESGLDWGATSPAWLVSIQNTTEESYRKAVMKFQALNEDALAEKARGGNFGFAMERLPNGEYAISSYVGRESISNFRVMRTDIYWEWCVSMFRKNSVLLPAYDDLIMRMLECGLISHWQSEGVYLNMDSNVQKSVKLSNSQKSQKGNIVKLKWTHVEGAFAILCLGHLVGAVVFILELLRKPNFPPPPKIFYCNAPKY